MTYVLSDVLDEEKHPELQSLLRFHVSDIFIEFTIAEVSKPHVELKFKLTFPATVGDREIAACSIGANPGSIENEATSATFRLLSYSGPSSRACASFRFPAEMWKLSVYIERLKGINLRPGDVHASDLTRFVSTLHQTPSGLQLDGCRDLVTQWFLRLIHQRMVEFTAHEVFTSYDPSLILTLPLRFDRFIARGFRKQSDTAIEMTENIPMYRGTFLDPRFVRGSEWGKMTLPYIPLGEDPSWGS